MDVKDLDRQYVAGLGIRHRDGASERVEAVPVKSVEGVYGGVWPYLSVRDLAGVVDDRVARLDREHRLLLVVPDVVDPVLRKIMRPCHRQAPPVRPCPKGTLSTCGFHFYPRAEHQPIRGGRGLASGPRLCPAGALCRRRAVRGFPRPRAARDATARARGVKRWQGGWRAC